MKYLLQAAVLLLMLAVGISLRPGQIWNNWRRLTLSKWMRLIAATFLLPPTLALALGNLLSLDGPATAGLFLIGAVPGAPLMTRGAAQRGFDVQMAASYQVWSGLLTPVIVPLLVATGGWLYGREIWVPPMKLLSVIAQQQFLPLLVGMVFVWLVPAFSRRVQRALVPIGNVIILVVLVALLYKMGPALKQVSLWLAAAALLLALGCLFGARLLLGEPSRTIQTLSVCNANRHIGLALLLSGQQMHDNRPVPAIAAYAIAALLVMGVYGKLAAEVKEPPST
ncbi:MAG TPA: bile acid:sodium symporter [Chthoniobacterales bacterium]